MERDEPPFYASLEVFTVPTRETFNNNNKRKRSFTCLPYVLVNAISMAISFGVLIFFLVLFNESKRIELEESSISAFALFPHLVRMYGGELEKQMSTVIWVVVVSCLIVIVHCIYSLYCVSSNNFIKLPEIIFQISVRFHFYFPILNSLHFNPFNRLFLFWQLLV